MIGAQAARRRLGGLQVAAFQRRNYRLFFGGQLISLIGTWMQQVAQGWLVLQLTGDPIWLGIVATAQFLPVVVLGLFAGVAADALPKRRILLATQVAMMVLAFVLAALVIAQVVEVWMIVGLAFLLGIANAIDMPVRQSFAVELVGREHVGTAVALNSAMFNGARIVGPAAAGLAIGAFGLAAAFLVNGVSFLAVIVGLYLMDEREMELPARIDRPSSAREVMAHLTEGLAYVRQTPVVLLAVLVVGAVATAGMNWNVLIPAFAQVELQSDAAGYGFLMAASGVGALLAALRLVYGRQVAPGPARDRGRDPRGGVRGPRRVADIPALARPDGRGRVRRDPDGGDRQHDHPAGRPGSTPRPGHERLHDRVQRVRATRRSAHGCRGLRVRDLDRHRPGRCPLGAHRRGRVRLGPARGVQPPEPPNDGRDPRRAGGQRRSRATALRKSPGVAGKPGRPRTPASAVDRAEHQGRVEPAEPERGREHPPVGPVAAVPEQAGEQAPRSPDRDPQG